MDCSSSSSLVQHLTPQLTKLLKAAKNCELRKLKKFLAAGGLPDTYVERTRSSGIQSVPLIFKAIEYCHFSGHHGSLKLLIDAKANLGCIVHGCTPLMCACEVASSDPLIILLQSGVDPCQQIPALEKVRCTEQQKLVQWTSASCSLKVIGAHLICERFQAKLPFSCSLYRAGTCSNATAQRVWRQPGRPRYQRLYTSTYSSNETPQFRYTGIPAASWSRCECKE
jgi:hypothetical protein